MRKFMNNLIQLSGEDQDTIYLCLFGLRFTYKNGQYIGWYKP